METDPADSTAEARPTDRLVAIMRRLRSEQGCPWDRKQTLDSLKKCLVEECYETLEAIDSGDRDRLREELGDVLLQVVFQSQICSEEGSFTFDDVARAMAEKLVRRHPHVFGDIRADTPEESLRTWEAIKREERSEAETPGSAVEGVPRHLPALLKAEQIQDRAARVGFDWADTAPVFEKLDGEIRALREAIQAGDPDEIRNELGDLLFAAVNLSRFFSCSSEEALQSTNEKFIRRFKAAEQRVRETGRSLPDCAPSELDAVWNDIQDEGAFREKPDPDSG